MDIPPNLLLTERVTTEAELPPEDVDFLLAEHRAHLDVRPTRQQGRYQLTPAGYVGTIVAPRCRLVIRPKLPLRNLFHLLDPTARLSLLGDRVSVVPGAEALTFLAGRLAQLLAERSAAGLHRAYIERAEESRFLQGQLDVAAHLRESKGRKDLLPCRFEEFSADVPCNQVPKATVELLLQSPWLGSEIRAALKRELEPFSEVQSITLGPDTFPAATDHLTQSYQPLLDLCRLLFESLRPSESAGSIHCPTFLLNMEQVFERYVTRGVQEAFADSLFTVAVQRTHSVNQPTPGLPDLQMRPDIVLLRNGEPVLVIDAKWKLLRRSPLVTDDVYQVLAYCTALGVRRAVLVYPGKRDRVWKYPLAHAPITVEIRKLRVVGSRKQCRRSLLQMAKISAQGSQERK